MNCSLHVQACTFCTHTVSMEVISTRDTDQLSDSYDFCHRTQAVLIEFTHYHKQTGILAPVSILLDQTQTGRILSFISIQPFHISPLFGPDLHIILTVLSLLKN